MEAIKNFVSSCIDKLKANPTLAYILIGLAAFIVVVLIVIIALCVKRSKTKKRLAIEAKEAEARARAEEKTAEEHAKREKLEAEKLAQKKAVEAKLAEQKRVAAEAEAKRRAEAEAEHERLAKEAEEKRLAEEAEKRRVAEEKAAAEEAKRLADEEAARKLEEATRKAEEATKKAEEAVKKAEAAKKAAKKATAVKATEVKPAAKKSTASKSTVKKEVAPAKAKTTKAVLYDEMKDAEVEDDIWYDESETEKAARYKGKWTIFRVLTDDVNEGEEMYFFELHASNGEKLLSSEEYTSYNGALRGIETHKANIEKGNFKVTLSKKGDYIFKLLSGKNMLLCMGENYPTKARCESAIESTKRFAKTAVIDENVQDHIIKVPAEDDSEVIPVPDGYNGKWLISSGVGADGEKVFYFELYANNGEKLLSSEEYASYIGAVNGIQTHKTNIEKGNFRISLTKRGDYIYKILNGNGQLLCLGEHYKTKRRCLNAVESVKRFAANSPVLADPELTK
ncbi:MAG: DUF1508 domain-containing protein [Clostridia bacterium]|nr:DUF1508 domain-containing protein [Clostridia bacterium]